MTIDPTTLQLGGTGTAGGDPEFQQYAQQYGGLTTTSVTGQPKDDPLYGFPADYETVFVLLTRGDPVTVQAPGAAGRRIGGEPFEPTGPTLTGGGGQQITLANLLRDYYRMSTSALGEYQKALWLGGFYDGKKAPAWGVADERGFAAWQTAALRAARAGKTLDEVLRDGVAARAEGESDKPPLSIRLTNPSDIARVAEAAAREVLGQKAPPEMVQSIVRRYQAAESAAQRGAYGTGMEGGTYTAEPRLEAFTLDALEQAYPVETEAYRGADEVMQQFGQIIEGPFG